MEKPKNSVNISGIKEGQVYVEWEHQTYYKDGQDDRISCYIPSFDIFFQAKSTADAERKSKIITEMFFDYYIIDEGKNSLKLLALKLHSLGFKAPKDMLVMKAFVNNHPVPVKFTSDRISSNGFSEAKFINSKSEMKLSHVAQ